jgi:hypothetical protein
LQVQDLGCPVLTESSGEGFADLLVVGLQAADPFGGGFQPAQQPGVGCPLPLRRRRCRCGGGMSCAEPFDLRAQVFLGVSQDRDTPASRLTASKVMCCPVASKRGSAAMARWRVCSARRRAAATTWWVLSARIGGLVFLVLFDLADRLVQVGEDLLVHLDPGLALSAGDLEIVTGIRAGLALT